MPLASAANNNSKAKKVFKAKVAAVTQNTPHRRFYLVSVNPRNRLSPAVGGKVSINMQLHLAALQRTSRYIFRINELTSCCQKKPPFYSSAKSHRHHQAQKPLKKQMT